MKKRNNKTIRKTLILIIVTISITLTTINSVSCEMVTNNERNTGITEKINNHDDPNIYHFFNVTINISGRCRTIGNNGLWRGYSYIGYLPFVICSCPTNFSSNQDPEILDKLHVTITNISSGAILLSKTIKQGFVCAHDVNGSFYWDAYGLCTNLIPPKISIDCHASGDVEITIYEEGKTGTSQKNPLFKHASEQFPLFQQILQRLTSFRRL